MTFPNFEVQHMAQVIAARTYHETLRKRLITHGIYMDSWEDISNGARLHYVDDMLPVIEAYEKFREANKVNADV